MGNPIPSARQRIYSGMLAYHRRESGLQPVRTDTRNGLFKVAHSTPVLEAERRWAPARVPRRVLAMLVALAAVAISGVSYIAAAGGSPASGSPAAVVLHRPGSPVSVVTGTPAAMTAIVASKLFTSSPVVIVASGARPAGLALAASYARRESAPVLLTSAGPSPAAGLLSRTARAEVGALHPDYVLAVGVAQPALAAQLPLMNVVTSPSALPAISTPAPLRHVALLVPAGRGGSIALAAAIATAKAAGAQIIDVRGDDPRADPAAIRELAATKPSQVIALGAGFGTVTALRAKIAVAETGVQLPGGGQVLFPMHRLVALYGHPGAPALGALGEQDLTASIGRVRSLAAMYGPLSRVPVVPAFEIIATVAQGSAGRNGLYSYESSAASLRPWVRRANQDGVYVILDLQPGRADLLAQAKLYQSLLKLPYVGLALDPEWNLQPGQVPLRQIGSVNISEVNSVVSWLAALTARYHLPQKLLVLHQFELSMINGESRLDTHHSDLAIVIHMDGQGAPSTKQQTWNAVVAAAPREVFFGWKNFFVKDHPMLTPRQTMMHRPEPVMISYQ
jgi:hypothetical protein